MANIFSDIYTKLQSLGDLVSTQRKALEAAQQARDVKAKLEAAQKARITPVSTIPSTVVPKLPSTPLTAISPKTSTPLSTGNVFKDIVPENNTGTFAKSTPRYPVKEAGAAEFFDFPKQAKEAAQATAREIVGAGLQATGKPAIQPTFKTEKIIFGEKPIKPLFEQGEETLTGFGVPEKYAKPLGVLAGPLQLVLDVTGFGAEERAVKNALEGLGKILAKEGRVSESAAIIMKRLKGLVTSEEAETLARKTAPLTDARAIDEELNTFAKSKAELRGKLKEEVRPGEEPRAKPSEEVKPGAFPKEKPRVVPGERNIFEGIVKRTAELPPSQGDQVIPKGGEIRVTRPPETRLPEVIPTPPPSTPTIPEEVPRIPETPIEKPVAEGAEPILKPKAGEGVAVLPGTEKELSKKYPPGFKQIPKETIDRFEVKRATPGEKIVPNEFEIVQDHGASVTLRDIRTGKTTVVGKDNLGDFNIVGGGNVPPKIGTEVTGAPKGKERKFLTSVKEQYPEFTEAIQKVDGQYIPRSTDELSIKARNLVKDNVDEAERIARSGTDENSVATASELIKHYNEKFQSTKGGDKFIFADKAASIAHDTAAKLTEQGRAVQAASILGRLTPEGMLRFAAREIEKYNAGIRTVGLGKVKVNLGKELPKLLPEQSAYILSEAKRIQSMTDGIEKAMAFNKLNNYIADFIPSTLYKKLIALWKAGLLTGIKTSGLNTFSNLSHGFSEIVKDVPAVFIDKVSSIFTGKNSLALTTRGATGGIKEGFEKGWRYLKTGFDERNVATKLDFNRVNFGDSKFAKGLQKYEETVFRILGAEDQPFYYGAKARSLYSQAIAEATNQGLKGAEKASFIDNLIKNPTDEMLKYAVVDAETAVFQNRTYLGEAAKWIQKIPVAGQIVIPFGRTPSAVAMQVINYSPIGIVKTIVGNIGRGRFDQRLFSQGMGRALTGTGIMAVGYELYKQGLMTLDRPASERERKLWELEGRTENSIKVGGKWRSPQVLGVIGNTLLIGGHFARAYEDTGSATKAIVQAIGGGVKSFTEQTFVKGMNQAVDALVDPQRSFDGFFTNLSGSIVPTLVADVARSTDVIERKYNGPAEKIKSRIPFLRQDLEPVITVMGGEVPRYGGNFLESMIDPTRPSIAKTNDVIAELRRLSDVGQKVSPTLLGDKNGYESLSPEQNTQLWERAGQITEEKLRKLFQLSEYQKLDDEGKGKIVEDFVHKSQIAARVGAVMEVTQGLSGEALKSKLSELKKSKLLSQEVFNQYLELR